MFPHPWACDWNDGELLFSCGLSMPFHCGAQLTRYTLAVSDNGQMGSAVILAKVHFPVEKQQQ